MYSLCEQAGCSLWLPTQYGTYALDLLHCSMLQDWPCLALIHTLADSQSTLTLPGRSAKAAACIFLRAISAAAMCIPCTLPAIAIHSCMRAPCAVMQACTLLLLQDPRNIHLVPRSALCRLAWQHAAAAAASHGVRQGHTHKGT
jgi:hypothetical protein